MQLIAELIGTYFLVFMGCASILVNLNYENAVTLPGIAMVWGLTVMILVYSLGHISGAHFNPAVSIAFAISNRFPCNHVSNQYIYHHSPNTTPEDNYLYINHYENSISMSTFAGGMQ